eukprot:scaffold467_cov403-Prasinococcus_capsulatus_cf.AAC.12
MPFIGAEKHRQHPDSAQGSVTLVLLADLSCGWRNLWCVDVRDGSGQLLYCVPGHCAVVLAFFSELLTAGHSNTQLTTGRSCSLNSSRSTYVTTCYPTSPGPRDHTLCESSPQPTQVFRQHGSQSSTLRAAASSSDTFSGVAMQVTRARRATGQDDALRATS